MLDILSVKTERYELEDIKEHIKRIFDLALSCNAFEIFKAALAYDDDNIAIIKVETLRCIGLLSHGFRLFAPSDLWIGDDEEQLV